MMAIPLLGAREVVARTASGHHPAGLQTAIEFLAELLRERSGLRQPAKPVVSSPAPASIPISNE